MFSRDGKLHIDLPSDLLPGEKLSAYIKRIQMTGVSEAQIEKSEPGQRVAHNNNARMDGGIAADATVGE
ncbi:MAG: hypothetical protein AAB838_02300 [Patescibacteria group bacterium]